MAVSNSRFTSRPSTHLPQALTAATLTSHLTKATPKPGKTPVKPPTAADKSQSEKKVPSQRVQNVLKYIISQNPNSTLAKSQQPASPIRMPQKVQSAPSTPVKKLSVDKKTAQSAGAASQLARALGPSLKALVMSVSQTSVKSKGTEGKKAVTRDKLQGLECTESMESAPEMTKATPSNAAVPNKNADFTVNKNSDIKKGLPKVAINSQPEKKLLSNPNMLESDIRLSVNEPFEEVTADSKVDMDVQQNERKDAALKLSGNKETSTEGNNTAISTEPRVTEQKAEKPNKPRVIEQNIEKSNTAMSTEARVTQQKAEKSNTAISTEATVTQQKAEKLDTVTTIKPGVTEQLNTATKVKITEQKAEQDTHNKNTCTDIKDSFASEAVKPSPPKTQTNISNTIPTDSNQPAKTIPPPTEHTAPLTETSADNIPTSEGSIELCTENTISPTEKIMTSANPPTQISDSIPTSSNTPPLTEVNTTQLGVSRKRPVPTKAPSPVKKQALTPDLKTSVEKSEADATPKTPNTTATQSSMKSFNLHLPTKPSVPIPAPPIQPDTPTVDTDKLLQTLSFDSYNREESELASELDVDPSLLDLSEFMEIIHPEGLSIPGTPTTPFKLDPPSLPPASLSVPLQPIASPIATPSVPIMAPLASPAHVSTELTSTTYGPQLSTQPLPTANQTELVKHTPTADKESPVLIPLNLIPFTYDQGGEVVTTSTPQPAPDAIVGSSVLTDGAQSTMAHTVPTGSEVVQLTSKDFDILREMGLADKEMVGGPDEANLFEGIPQDLAANILAIANNEEGGSVPWK